MNNCIAAIDAGTGSVRCVLYDTEGNALGSGLREISSVYTPDGRAEQNPNSLIASAFEAVREAVTGSGIDASAIVGVSFSGIQTTFVPVDSDGNCLTNIILWQDMRGMEMFPLIRKKLSGQGLTEDDLYQRTLRPLDTLLAGAKLLWLRENAPDIFRKTDRLINPQSVLLRAFGAEDYTSDCTDAGWWMSHDAVTMAPDPELSAAFGFAPSLFPEIRDACEAVGRVSPSAAANTGLKAGTPLFQGAVDQCCAALGAGNYGTPDLATMCLGTAGVITTYSENPIPDPRGRYYVLHYPTGGYFSELAVPVAASAFRWVRDMLYPADLFSHEGIYSRMDAEAASSPIGSGGVLFLPHLSGSIYPKLDTSVRGGYIGASLSTSRADLTRAAMEGVAFGMRHILESGNLRFKALRLLGGASRSDLWNRMQADIYGCPVETIAAEEASALGAAMIGAAGAGLYPSLKDAVKGMSQVRKRYEPDPERAGQYEAYYRAWLCCAEDLSLRAFPALENIRTGQR
ncbi:MAG: hypothetical protein IKM02_07875 [Clostridia bacterium]|nr:hypothetical protein [Clostridia bacterium]